MIGGVRAVWLLAAVAFAAMAGPWGPMTAEAHPLGNFSISHYSGLRVTRSGLEVTYVVDMAEIPTFQEMQEHGLVAESGHATVPAYLARRAAALREGLIVEIAGRRLPLVAGAAEIIFPEGAGGLPTLRLGVSYRAAWDPLAGLIELRYRDANFPGRAGWKEIVAEAGNGVELVESTASSRDRSRQLGDYPTDLLSSPPQDLAARIAFTFVTPPAFAAGGPPPARPEEAPGPPGRAASARPVSPGPAAAALPAAADAQTVTAAQGVGSPGDDHSDLGALALAPNRQATPRGAFGDLIAMPDLNAGLLAAALLIAAGLGALHALEPGHGKTVVGAYLVGSRGTARQAVWLGLIVTASHTAGVYLLGAVTLYASRYVVPERLYPWLGALSGVAVAGVGLILFLQRWSGQSHGHHHGGAHGHHHGHEHPHHHHHHHHHHAPGHAHHHGVGGSEHDHLAHSHAPAGRVGFGQLIALGVSGGIVPCPAALVVLLAAVAMGRVAFGLLLIVAFSAGLAAVLIAIGLLVVWAGQVMGGRSGNGALMTRWLPLASAAVVAVFGLALVVQSLTGAGVLQINLAQLGLG